MSEVAHNVTNLLPFKIALIGVLGIGAQWLAWRLQRPAIVLMAIAGLMFGPLLAWLISLPFVQDSESLKNIFTTFHLDPEKDFGDLYRPMVGIAVAIILFEGGLNLRFKDLRDASHAVTRMVLVAAPIAWVLGSEGQGLRSLTRKHCDYLVRIPTYHAQSSLNVSVATGICCFETRRQQSGC